MKEQDIKYRVKAALTFMARGGMRASLFEDTVEMDRTAMLEAGIVENVPKSMHVVMDQAITEWREAHEWLRHMPDKLA